MILLLLFTKLFILVWIYIDFYVVVLIAIHTTGINLSILLIIIFVSNVVLMNAIDYLGIIESVLFLVYIRPLQFSMIMFILSNDLLISFISLYWFIKYISVGERFNSRYSNSY